MKLNVFSTINFIRMGKKWGFTILEQVIMHEFEFDNMVLKLDQEMSVRGQNIHMTMRVFLAMMLGTGH